MINYATKFYNVMFKYLIQQIVQNSFNIVIKTNNAHY